MGHTLIASRGAYARTLQPIQSSNGTAVYAGGSLWAAACIPSSIVACLWPSGSQTTSVYVHIPWRVRPVPTMECRVFALLGLQGAVLTVNEYPKMREVFGAFETQVVGINCTAGGNANSKAAKELIITSRRTRRRRFGLLSPRCPGGFC